MTASVAELPRNEKQNQDEPFGQYGRSAILSGASKADLRQPHALHDRSVSGLTTNKDTVGWYRTARDPPLSFWVGDALGFDISACDGTEGAVAVSAGRFSDANVVFWRIC